MSCCKVFFLLLSSEKRNRKKDPQLVPDPSKLNNIKWHWQLYDLFKGIMKM